MRSLLVGAKGSVFTAASVAADDVSEQEHYVSSELFRRGLNNTEQVCLTEEPDDDSSFSEVHVDEDLSLSVDDINVIGYIGGYVAHKLRVTYPSLGVPTDKVSTVDERCSWTSKLSRGGLLVPSNDWLEFCMKLDAYFHSVNKCDIRRKHTLSYIFQIAPKPPEGIPVEAVQLFLKVRIFTRLRLLNQRNATTDRTKRKKLKKIT